MLPPIVIKCLGLARSVRLTQKVSVGCAVLFLVATVLASILAPYSARSASLETKDLIINDGTASRTDDRLLVEGQRSQKMFDDVIAMWAADPYAELSGKIHVILQAPLRENFYSVFMRDGQRRIVRVFGFDPSPQEMAHKFTSAIFPQPDKLIRNMMGIVTEIALGNPLTFPMCGLVIDDWVSAFMATGSHIPLSALGADHESWGMRISDRGEVTVLNRARQHQSYAEAGSFGSYVLARYGIAKLKQLHQLSKVQPRPFTEVFGISLDGMEADWLATLARRGQSGVEQASRLLVSFPETACGAARRRFR